MKDSIQIIVKFRVEIIFARFSCTEHILEGCTKYRAQKRLYSNALKQKELETFISLKENKLGCFVNR